MYLRISSDRGGEGLGVERQRQDCAELIDRRGWDAVKTYTENDTSAAGRKPRPGFRALIAAIRAREIDVVVAWALDRLARTARDRLELVEACRDAEVMIALVRGTDMDPTTPGGRLAIGILGEVAQHEIDQKADRQRRAAIQAAEDGRWIGGNRPFGYDPDGITVRPREAEVIREAYVSLLAGESLRGIAKTWNAAGYTTSQASRQNTDTLSQWNADSARRVLLNPRYAGLRAHHGTIVGPARWPALVSEQTWRAARAVLQDPRRLTGNRGVRMARHLLSSLATCGLCGTLVSTYANRHGKPVYRCRSGQLLPDQRPTVTGTHVQRLVAPADAYVGAAIVARLARPDARSLLVDQAAPDVAALQDEALTLERRLEDLAAEFGAASADPLPPREYRAMRTPLVDKIREIEAQIADAGRVSILGELVGADDVAAIWEQLGLDRRRAVVAALVDVRLHATGIGTRKFRPETVEIIWKS